MKSQKILLSYGLRSKKLDLGDMGPEDVSRHKSRTQAPIFTNRSTQFSRSIKSNHQIFKKFCTLSGWNLEIIDFT